MGSRGDYLPLRVQGGALPGAGRSLAGCRAEPCRVQGGALLKWRAFTEADLAQPNLRSAPQSVPRRGTLWEGGARLLTAQTLAS